MKKYVLLAAILALLSIISQAQGDVTAGIHGKLTGYLFSSPDSRKYETSFTPGFEFGGFARIPVISERFYFQPEFGFGYTGGSISVYNLDDMDYKSAAFNIPLLFGATLFKTPDGTANFRFYAGLGNAISLLNNISILRDKIDETVLEDLYLWKSSIYELSGVVGLGFDIMDFAIDLRYARGFNSTVKYDGDSFYQNTFTLAIGYKFKFIHPK